MCGVFRGNVASWPLLPLRTHFVGQLLGFLCRPEVAHTSAPCPDWVTLAYGSQVTFPSVNLSAASLGVAGKKTGGRNGVRLRKPTIQVFRHEVIRL